MASVVRMPSVLAGATEAVVASWLVAPGNTVAVGDPLAEIETEKAIVEYGAEEAGVVGRIMLAAGDTGEIGAPIAVLVKDGETDADIDAALGAGAPAAAPDVPSAPVTPVTPAAPLPSADPAAQRPEAGQAARAPARTRLFASPIVRKIAGEKGIDLTTIAGTGPNGRIVRRDLERLADRSARAGGRSSRWRPAGAAAGRGPAGRGPGLRRRHAYPAPAYPARDRAPSHREQGDDAALLPGHGVRRRRTARAAQADQRDGAGKDLDQRLCRHGGRRGLR